MDVLIEAEQWPIAAGCIGLAKLYDERQLPRTTNGIIFKEEILDTLAEKFVYSLIDNFSVVKRDIKRFLWYANQALKKPENAKQYAQEVRKGMNEQYKKVEKYFSETEEAQQLKEIIEGLKEVNKKEDAPKIGVAIEAYEKIAKTDFINERLTLNYVKSVILNPFFGQTSILQPSFNSKTTNEHIQQIEKDFIIPARIELQFNNLLTMFSHVDEIKNFLEQNSDYKLFRDINRKIKKMNFEEIKEYFEQMLPCSLIDGLIASQSFEEMIFSPLSFSKSKATNFNWNFNNELPVPISALARLVLLMAPLGMAIYTRKIGNIQTNEKYQFAGMLLAQKSFEEVIKENFRYQTLRREGSSFGEAIIGILQETVDKAKRIKDHSYQFVEMHSEYQAKKTLLDYYHMPPYLTKYLSNYGNSLKWVAQKDIKDEFFRAILKGIDPKQIIFDYLRLAIKDSFHAKGSYYAARERKRILEAKRGAENMTNYDKTISFIFYRGQDLRKSFTMTGRDADENAPYRASGQKKLEGVAYRLLNAAKAGNKHAFMDTIFRIHLAANLEVPSVFVDVVKKDGLDFESIATAFIAGMLHDEKKENEEEDKNE